MKRLLSFILILLLLAALVAGVLIGTGTMSVQSMLNLLPEDWNNNVQLALETGAQLYSQLADHQPPSGEGELLQGELPEDLLPQAESLYSFPAERYPYRAMLTESEQAAYDQIYANAMELYQQLPLHTPVSIDSISRVMNAIFYDHPELFWVETNYRYNYRQDDSVVAVTLSFNETAQDIEIHRARFEEAAQRIILGAQEYGSPVEQEKYVHDYLLDHVSYQLDAPLNQSAYSALVYGESVCAGYSRAFQYVLLELGIPCYYCSGYAGESHAWNIVKLGDGYYHVDVTWDDPLGNESGRHYYNYFNLTDREIAEDHTRTDLSLSLPACTATEFCYGNIFGEAETYATRLRTVEEAGFRPSDALSSLQSYYQYCEDRLTELGQGTHTLSLVLASEELLERVFALTEDGQALESYVYPAAERLGWNGYSVSVSLQGEALEDGYWLLTQQISLEGQTAQVSPPSPFESESIPEDETEPPSIFDELEAASQPDPPNGFDPQNTPQLPMASPETFELTQWPAPY